MFVLFVIQDLEVEAEQVNGDGVFPGVVLLAACEEGLSEEESRHPEHSRRPLIVPVLKTQQVKEDHDCTGLIHNMCKNARMNKKQKMSQRYHEHSQNKYTYEPYSSTESLSLQIKTVCLFFGSQAVQPWTPANRQTRRAERFI